MAKISPEKMEQMSRANEMLFREKACPACGSRMVVCEKPSAPEVFPRINVGDREAESLYYCPVCQSYHSPEQPYQLYEPKDRPAFAGDGRRYRYSKLFLWDRVLRVLLMQVAGAVCVLPLLAVMVYRTATDFGLLNWAGMLLCGVALFILIYFSSYYIRIWRVCKQAYFELGEEGVIFNDGAQILYMPWQDFRLAEALRGEEGTGDSFIFDTTERTFVINQNLEDYQDAAMRIARRIREDVPMDPRLTTMVF